MEQQRIRPLRYIRKQFKWQEYVEANYQVKYAGDHELRINCPACGDSKYKLYINSEKKVFHCFKCDFTTKKGAKDVFDFVAITEGLNKGQAILKLLREYKPVTPEDFEAALEGELDRTPEQVKKFKHAYLAGLPEVAVPLNAGSLNNTELQPFWKYLYSRGLTEREISLVLRAHVVPTRSFEIYGNNGKLKGDIGRRILWPIYGGDNKLVSWQARAFESADQVKYFNAPDTDLMDTVWPYVPPKAGATVVLGEGVLDALALRRLPQEYAGYATFSKHISKGQIKLLKDWGVERVILFWDKDAKREIRATVKDLQLHFKVAVPNTAGWPDKMDCGDCLKSEDKLKQLAAAVTTAIPVNTMEYVKWELT